MNKRISSDRSLRAYIIGLALGDGNLSNPNGRAVSLRITCDKKYPTLYSHIAKSIQELLPDNKVGVVNSTSYVNVYCYSNKWEEILGWKAKGGSKYHQKVRIPNWILKDPKFTKECLGGLVQTDGSIYQDRKYLMVNIVSNIPSLAKSIVVAIKSIGYKPNIQLHQDLFTLKHTIRISKDSKKFIDDIAVWKA
ncbi:MAG: hypothetical protein V4690_02125 [Patescibacteria group bacterium]